MTTPSFEARHRADATTAVIGLRTADDSGLDGPSICPATGDAPRCAPEDWRCTAGVSRLGSGDHRLVLPRGAVSAMS